GESRWRAVPYALGEKVLEAGLELLFLARRGSALTGWNAAVARWAAARSVAVAGPVALAAGPGWRGAAAGVPSRVPSGIASRVAARISAWVPAAGWVAGLSAGIPAARWVAGLPAAGWVAGLSAGAPAAGLSAGLSAAG